MSLLQLTRQQIRNALDDANPAELCGWIIGLAIAAGWCDPTTGQVTSPGLQQLLRLHCPGASCSPLVATLQALPLPALATIALFAARHSSPTPDD